MLIPPPFSIECSCSDTGDSARMESSLSTKRSACAARSISRSDRESVTRARIVGRAERVKARHAGTSHRLTCALDSAFLIQDNREGYSENMERHAKDRHARRYRP